MKCSAAAPAPKVLCNDHYVYLIFYKEDISVSDAAVSPFNRVPVDQICSIRFSQCIIHTLGHPTDETLASHPYAEDGLTLYTLQEVMDSPWAEDLMNDHSIHPLHNEADWKEYRHFILPFKDSCFEVVCKHMDILESPSQTMKEEVLKLADLI